MQNIVESLTLNYDGGPKLVGNFLAVFEDFYFIACDVTPNESNIKEIQRIITHPNYSDFYFAKIKADKTLLTSLTVQVTQNAVAKQTKDLFIRLGTACYLNPTGKSLNQAYKILTETESRIVNEYASTREKRLG